MFRVLSRNIIITAMVVAVVVQFDTPVRTVLMTAADRISQLFTGSSLGYGG